MHIHKDVCILSVAGTAARLRNISAYKMKSDHATKRQSTTATPQVSRMMSPKLSGNDGDAAELSAEKPAASECQPPRKGYVVVAHMAAL